MSPKRSSNILALAAALAVQGGYAAEPGTIQLLAAKEAETPQSMDALFDIEPAKAVPKTPGVEKPEKVGDPAPTSSDALFGLEPKADKAAAETPPTSRAELFSDAKPAMPAAEERLVWHGFARAELAYTYGAPEHWSKTLGRWQLGTQGRGDGFKWKATARLDYNPVYDLTDHYPKSVRDDQRAELEIRETYLDFTAGAWDWRVGRQHVVWGEMVGLFFADVVSAKDLREFVLPDFQTLRIPQWTARAEYFGDAFHAELIWIPFPSYDRIGKPGADFYPYPPTPPGVTAVFASEAKPGISLGNTNYGVRMSKLIDGWDLSGFYYRSTDAAATFYRNIAGPVFTYHPRHDRIWQAGGTLAKDLGPFVLKGEAIYTDGRKFNVLNITDPDGVVTQDTVDWVLGFDFNPDGDTRINTQLFQRIYLDHEADIIPEQHENGASLLVNRKFGRGWEGEVLLIASLNRTDWLLRPKTTWNFQPNWTLGMGVDVFHGPATGLLGRFNSQDRVWAELRYDF